MSPFISDKKKRQKTKNKKIKIKILNEITEEEGRRKEEAEKKRKKERESKRKKEKLMENRNDLGKFYFANLSIRH